MGLFLFFAYPVKISLTCQKNCVEKLSKKSKVRHGSVILLSILFILSPFLDARSAVTVSPPQIEQLDFQVKLLVDRQKRDEALKLIIQSIYSSQGVERTILIRKAHILGCTFMKNKTFQVFQEGHTLLLNKKYRLAREKFEKALSEEPDNVEILTRLGQSAYLDGDVDAARERLLAASSLNPFEPQVRLWLGKILLQKGNDKAVPELRAAYSELKESEQAVVWLSEALASFGQMSSAVRLLSADTKKWPFHVWSLVVLAKIQSETGAPENQSLWAARKALQLALSRLGQYPSNASQASSGPDLKNNLEFDVRRPASELKVDIQKLLNLVQSKLSDSAASKKRSL